MCAKNTNKLTGLIVKDLNLFCELCVADGGGNNEAPILWQNVDWVRVVYVAPSYQELLVHMLKYRLHYHPHSQDDNSKSYCFCRMKIKVWKAQII